MRSLKVTNEKYTAWNYRYLNDHNCVIRSVFRNNWIEITTTLAYKAVRGYQRYISPYKGFRCAHYQLHRETSCSGHFRDLLSQYGLSGALRLFPRRLVECRDAYFELKMRVNTTPTDGGSGIPASGESPERDEQPTAQNHPSDNDSVDAGECACTTLSCGVDSLVCVGDSFECLGGIASCFGT